MDSKLNNSNALNVGGTAPVLLTKDEIARVRKETKRLFVVTQSVANSFVQYVQQIPYASILLFSGDGVLLKLYGEQSQLKFLAEQGIAEWTYWDEAQIGLNILSSLKRRPEQSAMIGIQNGNPKWGHLAFYGARIMVGNDEALGYLAVVVPIEYKGPSFLVLANAICRSIEMQYLWFEMAQSVFRSIKGMGFLALDQSSGENRIIIMSDDAFHMLGMPPENFYYNHLERYIDPLPANPGLWNIIRQQRYVADKAVTIRCRGQEHSMCISTSKYEEPKFHISGIMLVFHSYQRIQRLASKYVGNIPNFTFDQVIGESSAFQTTIHMAKNAALSESNILLLGESGTGKDVLAQAIHNGSRRREQPFVALNCAAFSHELIGSELFGYEEGAFTGAKRGGRIGKFELANNGTLFLDEIGDMPMDLQAVLLRAIEEQSFRKIGGNDMIRVNVRILAATNKQLQEKVRNGLFREDLFYRLSVVRLQIPPLRERDMDILLLADYFIQSICIRQEREMSYLTKDATAAFLAYPWPGNIRELQNLLEGIISTHDSLAIDADTVTRYLGYEGGQLHTLTTPVRDSAECRQMRQALLEHQNNKTKAAASLGIPRRTFYRKLEKYGLD